MCKSVPAKNINTSIVLDPVILGALKRVQLHTFRVDEPWVKIIFKAHSYTWTTICKRSSRYHKSWIRKMKRAQTKREILALYHSFVGAVRFH